ncbi:MAG: hypothetical protein Q9202_007596 [Teloschistes flavicans]
MLLSHRTIAAVVDIPSALLPTSPTNDQYGIDCDGSRYGGYDLDAEDCLSAFHLIIDSDEELQFADRHSRAKELNMAPLPWRWMGVKGSCYFQPILKPGAEVGSTTLHDIRGAAYLMIGRCAMAPGHPGGIATKIPGDNNLSLLIGRYAPGPAGTTCTTRRAIIASCREIMYRVPTYTLEMRFGPKADPRMQVELPWVLSSRDGVCTMKVLTTNRRGESDETSWYQVWEAATAVWYKCVVSGYSGNFRGLGDQHDLVITIVGP